MNTLANFNLTDYNALTSTINNLRLHIHQAIKSRRLI